MTVFENLLVGAIFGAGQREKESYARCAEVLELTGLASRANMPARTLTLATAKAPRTRPGFGVAAEAPAARRDRRRLDRA